MPSDRFFINLSLESNQEVILRESEFHHLQVMRIKEEEQIELVNGLGCLAQARIQKIEKKQAFLHVTGIYKQEIPLQEVILAQAIPRLNRLDFIIEKGTELGVTKFLLFPGALSERKNLTDHQIERMHQVTIAAMKQCGRLFLPKIEFKPPLEKWDKLQWASYFGDVSENAPLFRDIFKHHESVLFFIGPESGFSERERDLLLKLEAKGVKLHENILRTDTAALVALSLITH